MPDISEDGIRSKFYAMAIDFSAVVVKFSVVSAYHDQTIDAEEVQDFTKELMRLAMLRGWLTQCEIYCAEDEVIPYNKD
jgi:hypothetical protein